MSIDDQQCFFFHAKSSLNSRDPVHVVECMIKPLDVVYVVSEPNNRAFSHRNLFPLQHYVDGFLHLFHALDGRGMDKKGGRMEDWTVTLS
ncbi:MAG: hypothetical protein J4F28_05875 [Nitrosopumilaceae archaeon]|nr:hypothetical protein [Nitrosopumilaceae archaeon]